MPANIIKHDVKEGLGTKKALEKKWDRAKDIAKGHGKGKSDWPLVMHIYQNMRDSKKSKASTASVLCAAFRIKAWTELEADSFEGWVNTLQERYDRPEGADYVTLDIGAPELETKLKALEWTQDGNRWTKGDHTVQVDDEDGRAKITSVK